MFYIEFHYPDGSSSEVYGGGTYIFQGEKYAVLNGDSPKLYKSEKVAERSAKRLFVSCTNTGNGYSIVDFDTRQKVLSYDSCTESENERDLAVYKEAYAEYLSSGEQSAPVDRLWDDVENMRDSIIQKLWKYARYYQGMTPETLDELTRAIGLTNEEFNYLMSNEELG